MNTSDDRCHVMLAVRFKLDVSQQDDLVVPTHLFEGSLQVLSWIVEISRKPFFIGARTRAGVPTSPSRSGSSPDQRIQRAHCILRLLARGSLKGFCTA